MNITNIQQNKGNEVANRVLILNDGTIVAGKITKIHPNNQAEIKIGNHTIMAKVLTPLTIGERYFFQVQQNDQQVQLKVIGNALQSDQTENVTNLLQRLGVKVTKQNIQFVQSLINEKIPFNQSEITQAIHLLEGLSNPTSKQSQQIIQQMMANKLPLTQSVYQSLQAFQQHSISGMMNDVLVQMQQMHSLTESQSNIIQSVQQLLNKEITEPLQRIFSILSTKEQHTLFNLLQRVGLVSSNVTFNEWNHQLQQIIQQTPTQHQHHINVNHSLTKSMEQVLQTLSHLVNNRAEIQSVTQTILNTFFPSNGSQPLTNSQFVSLKNEIQQQLFPLVPKQVQQQLQTMLLTNQQNQIAELHSVLSMLSQQSTNEMFQSLLTLMSNNELTNSNTTQQQFLSFIRDYGPLLGLSDEFQLTEQLRSNLQQQTPLLDFSADRQSHSIKSMLLQLVQQGNQLGASNKAQQLLHFINGMQLQSIHESAHLLQAFLQIPGDKFGAYKDMTMQFEGQKTQDGKLNSEFCRILFVLDLANIRETMIDMNVQKRMISMTIFNDKVTEQSVRPLEEQLKYDLESLNFQLSSIKIKLLKEREETPENKPTYQKERPVGEGIEFFV